MGYVTFGVAAGLALLVGCSSSTPDPLGPATATRGLGLALEPGPCVQGKNVVHAAVFVAGIDGKPAHLQPTDGQVRFELVADERLAPVRVTWLAAADPVNAAATPSGAWNLELTFDSPRAGPCPLRAAFEPSAEGVGQGLGPASTTILLKEAPPPPPRN